MNVNLIRIRGLVRELQRTNQILSRIADSLEADLVERGVPLERGKPSDNEPPELFITNEEDDYVREAEDEFNRLKGKQVDEAT